MLEVDAKERECMFGAARIVPGTTTGKCVGSRCMAWRKTPIVFTSPPFEADELSLIAESEHGWRVIEDDPVRAIRREEGECAMLKGAA